MSKMNFEIVKNMRSNVAILAKVYWSKVHLPVVYMYVHVVMSMFISLFVIKKCNQYCIERLASKIT